MKLLTTISEHVPRSARCMLPGLMMLLLAAAGCQGSEQTYPDLPFDETDTLFADTVAEADTLKAPAPQKEKKTKGQEARKSTPETHKYSSPRNRYSYYEDDDDEDDDDDDKDEDDGMRGFDPTSEDDMDDNGMSRYMEVYDEEGWQ